MAKIKHKLILKGQKLQHYNKLMKVEKINNKLPKS